MIEEKNVSKVKYFIILHILLAVYSLSGICSKLAAAAGEEGNFLMLVIWYGLVVLNLGVYAIVWQQIIKHLPLNTAYSNKAVTVAWGILWGALFFKETIKWNMIVGAVIVIAGVVLVVRADE